MSVHYHVNIFKVGVICMLMSVGSFGKPPYHPEGFDTPIFSKISPTEEDSRTWEFGMQGDQEILSCTLESSDTRSDYDTKIQNLLKNPKFKDFDIPDTDGICEVMGKMDILDKLTNNTSTDVLIKALLDGLFSGDYFDYESKDFIYEFIGKDNIGSSFDLGGFAQCNINLPDVKDTFLAKLCRNNGDANATFSPAATLTALTVDGAGLPSFSGKEDVNGSKKVDKRKYSGGLTGKEIFRESRTSGGTPDGGFLLGKAKEDPYGSTAVALNSFDKPTMVLKTLAVMNSGTDDINETLLPATKADAMDMEDEIVGLQTRMAADLNQFIDTLTRALQSEFADINMTLQHTIDGKPHLMSLARYEFMEKNVTAEFFKSKESGLADIYKGIEEEAKAQMASELLLMTADPNYIADPSEARAALVKPSQRNKFRYAALIQQEKNKQIKLKYALQIKRGHQMVGNAKKIAYLNATTFRPEAAKHELKHLLDKADESVSLEGNKPGPDGKCPDGSLPVNGKCP